MSTPPYDCILIGQGLAGTALAWRLHWRGFRVLVVDREPPVTASRVAAGLLTPITGKRLATFPDWDLFWPEAVRFYRRVESETGSEFFHQRPAIRSFASEEERDLFDRRLDPALRSFVRPADPPLREDWFDDTWGAIEMPEAGRLEVTGYLDASRRVFLSVGAYRNATIDPERDIEPDDNAVRIPSLGVQGRWLVFCQGYDPGSLSRWFSPVRFNPAKGEILTVRVPGLQEPRVIHRGVWLAPAGEGQFRVGATYVWDRLDCEPTETGREELCRKLAEFLKLPFETVGQAAAVRPTMHDFQPVLGLHPLHRRIGIFNGLGSRGSLLAPRLARLMSELLVGGAPLSPEIDVRRWYA
jgi:glycine oxidase